FGGNTEGQPEPLVLAAIARRSPVMVSPGPLERRTGNHRPVRRLVAVDRLVDGSGSAVATDMGPGEAMQPVDSRVRHRCTLPIDPTHAQTLTSLSPFWTARARNASSAEPSALKPRSGDSRYRASTNRGSRMAVRPQVPRGVPLAASAGDL